MIGRLSLKDGDTHITSILGEERFQATCTCGWKSSVFDQKGFNKSQLRKAADHAARLHRMAKSI